MLPIAFWNLNCSFIINLEVSCDDVAKYLVCISSSLEKENSDENEVFGLGACRNSFLDFNHCTEQDVEVEGAMAADHLNAKFINLDLDLNKVQGKINE